jgi:hypothetical protein
MIFATFRMFGPKRCCSALYFYQQQGDPSPSRSSPLEQLGSVLVSGSAKSIEPEGIIKNSTKNHHYFQALLRILGFLPTSSVMASCNMPNLEFFEVFWGEQ